LGTTDLHPEAIILLASVKLLNGNEALSGEVGSFLKEIQVQITNCDKETSERSESSESQINKL